MSKRLLLRLLPPLLVGLSLLAAPTGAGAQEAAARILPALPAEATVGLEEPLYAYLRDSTGAPIVGARVTFHIPTAFMNTVGEAMIGEAITDESGLASFTYTPRRDGEIAVTVRFGGDDRWAPVEETRTLTVRPGSPVYVEETPTRIPGLNYRLLIVLLGGTWGLFLVAIWHLWKVSRARPQDPSEALRV